MALTKGLLDRLLDENLTLLPSPNQLASRPSTKSQPKRRYASSNSLAKQGRCDEEKLDPRLASFITFSPLTVCVCVSACLLACLCA